MRRRRDIMAETRVRHPVAGIGGPQRVGMTPSGRMAWSPFPSL